MVMMMIMMTMKRERNDVRCAFYSFQMAAALCFLRKGYVRGRIAALNSRNLLLNSVRIARAAKIRSRWAHQYRDGAVSDGGGG